MGHRFWWHNGFRWFDDDWCHGDNWRCWDDNWNWRDGDCDREEHGRFKWKRWRCD